VDRQLTLVAADKTAIDARAARSQLLRVLQLNIRVRPQHDVPVIISFDMLTRRRTFAERDAPDEVIHIEPDAEFVEHRTRDLGIPDGVWWSIAALGGVLAMVGVISALHSVLGEVATRALSFGVGVSVWTVAARRWGHRRFRWRAAVADGLWFGLLAVGLSLVHELAERLFDMLRG